MRNDNNEKNNMKYRKVMKEIIIIWNGVIIINRKW